MGIKKRKIVLEKTVVEKMIAVYCRRHHGTKRGLCEQCVQLKEYAYKRLDSCRYGEEKPFCSKCATHCYHKEMKEKIAKVMQFSGPRMPLYHPIIAIKHFMA